MAIAVVTQALEISITLAPVLLINAGPKLALAAAPPVILTDILGLTLGVGGLSIEAIAQWQKGTRHETTLGEDKVTRGTSLKRSVPERSTEEALGINTYTQQSTIKLPRRDQPLDRHCNHRSWCTCSGACSDRLGLIWRYCRYPCDNGIFVHQSCFRRDEASQWLKNAID
jgi:hypothetical protein